MTLVDGVPDPVRKAGLADCGTGVTGYLFEAELEGFCLIGRIFFDQKDRFKNGRLIRTSTIREFSVQGDYLRAVTFTDSVYVLINADPSLFNLRIRGSDESLTLDG